MRDHDLPIALDDINLAFDDYVDWSDVDFLKHTQQSGVAATPKCPEHQVSGAPEQDRTLFRTTLINTVLEADAMVKSQAFYEWLNQRQLERDKRATQPAA